MVQPGPAPATDEVTALRERVRQLEQQLAHVNAGWLAGGIQWLQVILRQLPAVMWATDRNLRYTSAAGSGTEALHKRFGDVRGRFVHDIVGTRDPDHPIIAAHLRALRGESITYDTELAGLTFHCRLEPLRDPDTQEIVGCVGLAHDITEIKQAERRLAETNAQLEQRVEQQKEELRQSETLFRVTLDQMPDLFVVHETDGPPENHRILLTNHTTADTLGYRIEELVGRSVIMLQDSSLAAGHMERTQLAAGGEALVYEGNIRRRDGSVFPAEIRTRQFEYAGRRVTMSIARDLTRRKTAERQLRLVQSAVEQVTDAVTITDAELDAPGPRIIYVNPAFERITGYRSDEVLGKSPRILQGPETNRAVLDELRRRLARGQVFEGETVNYRKDGTPFVVEWRVTPVRDETGRITNFMAIQRDMTETRRAEEVTQQHRNELAHVARLSTMGEMASGLAHELNQPLAAISNYARGCLRRMETGKITLDEVREALDQVAAQSERAGKIIQRLRHFVRKREPRRSDTNLNELVRDCAGFLEREIVSRRVTLRLELDESLPVVETDSIQIEQVVLNLLLNAMDAMANTPVAQRIVTVTTRNVSDDTVELSVSDRGVGLSESEINHVFDPFYTTKQNGMGMGLTISKTIVEAHSGRLQVLGNPGCGATFQIHLPKITY